MATSSLLRPNLNACWGRELSTRYCVLRESCLNRAPLTRVRFASKSTVQSCSRKPEKRGVFWWIENTIASEWMHEVKLRQRRELYCLARYHYFVAVSSLYWLKPFIYHSCMSTNPHFCVGEAGHYLLIPFGRSTRLRHEMRIQRKQRCIKEVKMQVFIRSHSSLFSNFGLETSCVNLGTSLGGPAFHFGAKRSNATLTQR